MLLNHEALAEVIPDLEEALGIDTKFFEYELPLTCFLDSGKLLVLVWSSIRDVACSSAVGVEDECDFVEVLETAEEDGFVV